MKLRTMKHYLNYEGTGVLLLLGLLLSVSASHPAAGAEKDLWDYSMEELAALRVFAMDHSLEKGEVLVGYQYMHMDMDGLRDGTTDIDLEEYFATTSYTMAPLEMEMEMHMLHLMYSPFTNWTLMLMAPYLENSMESEMRMGGGMGGGMGMTMPEHFNTENSGLGDIELTALNTFRETDATRLIFKLGLSLPTGSISNTVMTPMGEETRFPYPMRLGSGTYDLIPGFTYIFETKKWNLGTDFEGTFHLGENRYDYSLGDRYQLDGWVMRRITSVFALSARARGSVWNNIDGHDEGLDPTMSPTADPDKQGGRSVELFGGVNFFFDEGALRGNLLQVEVGYPVYQDLDGPQMKADIQYRVNWSWTF